MFYQLRQPDSLAGLVLAHEHHALRNFAFREGYGFKGRDTLAAPRQLNRTLERADLTRPDAERAQFRLGVARIVNPAGNSMQAFTLRRQFLALVQIARRLGDDAKQLEIILREHDRVVAGSLLLAVQPARAQRETETAILLGTFLQVADQQENMIDAFDRMRHAKLPFTSWSEPERCRGS